jgi:8-oxo-dGTP pyrophosphatase MutT (NUDIX family)
MSPYLRQLRALVGNRLVVMPSVTAIVRDERQRVLVVEDISTGYWTAPGGAVEPGELPADCLVREMKEELGVIVEPTAVLGVFGGPQFVVEYSNGDRVAYVTTLFECRIVDGRLTADKQELAQFRFIDPKDAAELRLAPWLRHVFDQLGSGGREVLFDPPSQARPAT